MTKICSTVIKVNGVAWSENMKRKELACLECGKPTRGRMRNNRRGRPPATAARCLDCAMKEALLPVARVKDFLRGLFA